MSIINNTKYISLALMIGFIFSQELEVEGNLKVSGSIDASAQRILNVGDPVENTDAVNLQYLTNLSSNNSSSSGGTIVLKCPWFTESITANESVNPGIGSCEPPECPSGWSEITSYNEVTGAGGGNAYNNSSWEKYFLGNSCRVCEKD